MLMLLFYAGKDAYAINSQSIEEVFPRINIDNTLTTPGVVLGQVNIRGQLIKAIDLTKLLTGRISSNALNTRMILLSIKDRKGNPCHLVLVAERAIETLEFNQNDFVAANAKESSMPFVSGIFNHPQRVVHQLDLEKVLNSIQGVGGE